MPARIKFDVSKVLRLYAEGESTRSIAELFGCTKGPIVRLLEREGVELRDSRRKKQVPWRAKTFREAFLINIKVGKECTDCGLPCDIGNYPVFDWDHLPGTVKLFDVGRAGVQSRSIEEIEAEIEKCELVCANCHRMRTFWRWRR